MTITLKHYDSQKRNWVIIEILSGNITIVQLNAAKSHHSRTLGIARGDIDVETTADFLMRRQLTNRTLAKVYGTGFGMLAFFGVIAAVKGVLS